jgi:hypothetical protein
VRLTSPSEEFYVAGRKLQYQMCKARRATYPHDFSGAIE